MRPLYDFDGVQNQWVKDGTTEGYLIEYNIQEAAKNYPLPIHPLGRVPVKIYKVWANIAVDFAVVSADENQIVLAFDHSPGNIRIRIE
jgi:hypothetical protein